MDFRGVPGKDPIITFPSNQSQKFKSQQLREGATGVLPDEIMEMILSLLDDQSLQNTVSTDQFLNEKTLSMVKHREVSSITQEVQLLVNELDAIIKGTSDELLKESCQNAKKELLKAAIGSVMGDSQNLIQIKRSSQEIRNAFIKALINLDLIILERLESNVVVAKKSIVLRCLFPYLKLLKTPPGPKLMEVYENYLHNKYKQISLEVFIPDFLTVVDFLNHASANQIKQCLLFFAQSNHPKLVYLISDSLPLIQEMDDVRKQCCQVLTHAEMIEEAVTIGNKNSNPATSFQAMSAILDILLKKGKFTKALQIAESFKGKPKVATGEVAYDPSSSLYSMCFYGILHNKLYHLAVKLLPSISFENGERNECEAALTTQLLIDKSSPCVVYLQKLYTILKIDEQQISELRDGSLSPLQRFIVNHATLLTLNEIQQLEDALPADFRTEFFIGIFTFARLLKTNNPEEVNQILEPLKKYCPHYQTDILSVIRDIKNPEIEKQARYWLAIQFANTGKKDLTKKALRLIETIIESESNERKREFYISEYLQIGSQFYEPEHPLMKKFLEKKKSI